MQVAWAPSAKYMWLIEWADGSPLFAKGYRRCGGRPQKERGSETEGPGNDDVVISNHLPVSGNFSFHSAAIRRWWRRRLVGPIPRKLFSQRWRKESLVLLSLCVVKSTTRGGGRRFLAHWVTRVPIFSPCARSREHHFYLCVLQLLRSGKERQSNRNLWLRSLYGRRKMSYAQFSNKAVCPAWGRPTCVIICAGVLNGVNHGSGSQKF